jgi:hypothetical protein
MSSSATGNLTAGQNVTYTIGFTTATAGVIKGLVVDFCDDTPIIGNTCGYTAGKSINISGVSLSSVTGTNMDTTVGNWTVSKTSPLLILTDSTWVTSTGAGVAVTFVITGVTNPQYVSCTGGTVPNCTFYARILTYATTAGATGYTPTAPATGGAVTDQGGTALSTNQLVTVTSKVMEQLTFCVFTGASCSAGGGAVTLGDTNGVLYTTGPFVDKKTQFTISTNAYNGVTVRMLGGTLTNTQNGSQTITAIGATPAQSSSGNDQFGLCVYGTSITATSPYNSAPCSGTSQTAGVGTATGGDNSAYFAFDTTGASSTYGSGIATASAGSSSGFVVFIGNVSVTQQAGIYTTTLTFVCTGSY